MRASERLAAIVADIRARAHPTGGAAVGIDGLDSLARLQLVVAVEEAFAIEFTDAELDGLRTLEHFEAAIAEKVSRAPAVAANAEPAASTPAPAPRATPPRLRRHVLARALLVAAMRTWFRVRVIDAEHLPRSGPCLLCANHNSHLDSLALLVAAGARRGDLVFSAARDYFFAGRGPARLVRHALPFVALERGGTLGGLAASHRALEACVAAKRIVVLFPEGTRSVDGELQPFKEGIGYFAEQLRVPVVPCWIAGTRRALPRGAWWPRPGAVTVRFGPPLAPGAGIEALTGHARAALLALRRSGTA